MDSRGFIYFLSMPSQLTLSGLIYKIGRTINPKQRFHVYPHRTIIALKECVDFMNKEAEIIYHYQHRAILGREWLDLDIVEKIEIKHFILGNLEHL